MPGADDDTSADKRFVAFGRRWRRRTIVGILAGVGAIGLWIAAASTLSLSAATARAEIEARIAALTGQPVIVAGDTRFDLLPRPRLELGDVLVGGEGPGAVLAIDRIRAELDLLDALFGRTDIAKLILIRPELRFSDGSSGGAPVAGPDAPAPIERAVDARAIEASDEVLAYGRSLLRRFEGVRSLELWDGVFRPRDGGPPVSAINLRMDWATRSGPVRLAGAGIWNGQTTQIEARLAEPLSFLAGTRGALALSLESPAFRIAFEGTGAGEDAVSLDGTLRLSTPSLERATRWLAGGPSVPDIGAVSMEARVRYDTDGRLAMDPVTLDIDGQTGTGVLDAVFAQGRRPVVSGTLAFPELDLSRFADGVAPLPAHPLDLQRPMAVSFLDAVDVDLRLSALDAGFAETPLRQVAATLKVLDAVATLDIGDAELLGGRAQGQLRIDLGGPRPMARGRVDLTGVDAAGLTRLARIRSIALTGVADLTARFETPATNWGEVLRENSSSIRVRLANGGIDGLSPRMFRSPGDHALAIQPTGSPAPFASIEAEFSTRGPYATLDSLRIEGSQGVAQAGGFLSLLDDRLFVEGTFQPSDETASRNDLFTTSQPIPFKIHGEWPTPTISVGVEPGMQPI